MDEAVSMVDKMRQHSAVNNKIYGFLIDGFLRNGDVSKALELLDAMRELECVPMVPTYTQLIQHLFRSEQYNRACEVYVQMTENGVEPDIVAATAMIAGYVQHDRISEAWELFEKMKKKGINFTWKAYSIFIKELCKASKPDEAIKLLAEIAASELNRSESLFGLVISYLKKSGDTEKVKIVKKMSNRPEASLVHEPLDEHHPMPPVTEAAELMQTQKEYKDSDYKELCRILSSSADWNSIEEALQRTAINFNPELVAAVLNSCQRHGYAALKFFGWLNRRIPNYRHTTATYNSAIKISGSAKDFRYMRELYQDMRRSRCLATADTWTIMISRYAKAGLTEIALRTFKEMRREGYQPTASTFKHLIIFFCSNKGQKLDEALKIFAQMVSEGFVPDTETTNTYLSALCESGMVSDARRCVKTLCKKSFFTKQLCYTLLVRGLCRAGRVEEALSLLTTETEFDGCIMDQFVYGSVIHALLRKGKLEEALEKMEEMKRAGVGDSVYVQNSFIVHFCREKQMDKAMEVLESMRSGGMEPSLVTYCALIRGYMNVGMVAEAWSVFGRINVEGLVPDFETYSMFMSCLCREGRSEEGLRLVDEMLERGMVPSAVNFRTVFRGLNREGKLELAQSVLTRKWKLKRERRLHNINVTVS